MLNLLQRKKTIDFSFLQTDIHSHILPGIDDGSDSVDTSIYLLEGLKRLGFKKFIFTPHIYTEFYPNDKKTIQDAFQKLSDKIIPSKSISYSAEYFLDNSFNKKIKTKNILCFNKNHVLFELSTFSAPLGIEEIIFELISSGYQPVLAHPERYFYLDIKAILKLKNIGCQLQSNLLSFNGFYGLNIKLKAWDIFDQGLCDYAGTDLHNLIQLTDLEKMSRNYSLMLKLSNHKWKNSYL